MTKRKDVHRPSAIDTNDYRYVAIGYMKMDSIGDCEIMKFHRDQLRLHQERTGATWSRHEHGGNCHVCGAHCLYTFIFHHAPTNELIKVGSTCVDKMDVEDGIAFKSQMKLVRSGVKDARDFKAGKLKAEALLKDEGFGRAWELYELSLTSNLVEIAADKKNELCDMDLIEFKDVKCDHDDQGKVIKVASYVWPYATLIDIVGKLVKWGNVSDKQMAFVGKLMTQCDDFKASQEAYKAKKAAERAAADDVPVTDERIEIAGEIVSVKFNDYWNNYQMLVKDDRGFKVWGSLPSNLDSDEAKGKNITFMARVTRSDKDSQFGFFKRPTKVQVAEAA